MRKSYPERIPIQEMLRKKFNLTMKIIAMPMELQTGESISYTIRIEFDKQIRKTQTQKSAIIKYCSLMIHQMGCYQ